jgi:hypothetical protein
MSTKITRNEFTMFQTIRTCLFGSLMVQQLLPKPIVHTCTIVTPLLEECEDDTHTPEMGTWESSGIPETSELDFRGQNTLS